MPRVSAAFFVTGGLFLLSGIFVGMYMGAHQDFRLAPAHAHINLVGWVTMALYGGFYALTAKTMSPRLAWANYLLALVGALIQGPSLGALIITGDNKYLVTLTAGESITTLALLVFLVSAFRELLRDRSAEAA
jgi:hypothetical protein